MQLFFLLAFLIVAAVAVFAVQNSSAPPVLMKFLLWQFETSLIYALLGTLAGGILAVLFLWIPSAFRNSFRVRNLKRENEALRREVQNVAKPGQPMAERKPG
jgi:uncharacterized integral membrane protein